MKTIMPKEYAAYFTQAYSRKSLLEFGCIGPGGVVNNKGSEHTVNECEHESACWCEFLTIRLSIYI